MSRIAKNSIKLNKDTNCNFENGIFLAKGKLGEMKVNVNSNYKVEISEESISIISLFLIKLFIFIKLT